MKIATKSFLKPVVEDLNKYAISDRRKMITAIPVITSKFEPSGSLNDDNNTFEHTKAVMAKIINVVFFDL
jgi:hypothetical protein